MTPTEQDKELQNWLVEHTALIEETGGAVWRELEVETFMYHLRELITADRKRVALEAKLETAEHIQNTMVHEAGGYCDEILPDAIPNYIAELKAQQEEL